MILNQIRLKKKPQIENKYHDFYKRKIAKEEKEENRKEGKT